MESIRVAGRIGPRTATRGAFSRESFFGLFFVNNHGELPEAFFGVFAENPRKNRPKTPKTDPKPRKRPVRPERAGRTA